MSRLAEPSPIPTTHIAGLATLASPGTGIPVVLVPGYTGSKEDFGPLVGELGRPTYAVDMPGQYESPGPESDDAYSTEAQAEAVLAFVDAVSPDGPVHLIAHSFGGIVCRALALAAPTRVRSLALVCSGPSAIPAPRRNDIELLVGGAPGHTMDEVWDVVAAYPLATGAEPESAFSERRWRASSVHGLVGMGRALLDEPDHVGRLAALRIPTIVMTGELDDAWAPATQQDMARRLGCEQVWIPGAGHSPAIEAPALTLAALKAWLRD